MIFWTLPQALNFIDKMGSKTKWNNVYQFATSPFVILLFNISHMRIKALQTLYYSQLVGYCSPCLNRLPYIANTPSPFLQFLFPTKPCCAINNLVWRVGREKFHFWSTWHAVNTNKQSAKNTSKHLSLAATFITHTL